MTYDRKFHAAAVEAGYASLPGYVEWATPEDWRQRESETQEALQAIGEEFGVHGGEPRTDGIHRVLTEQRKALKDAYVVLAFAFNRIHVLPRSRDTELASDIEKVRARIEPLIGKNKR